MLLCLVAFRGFQPLNVRGFHPSVFFFKGGAQSTPCWRNVEFLHDASWCSSFRPRGFLPAKGGAQSAPCRRFSAASEESSRHAHEVAQGCGPVSHHRHSRLSPGASHSTTAASEQRVLRALGHSRGTKRSPGWWPGASVTIAFRNSTTRTSASARKMWSWSNS